MKHFVLLLGAGALLVATPALGAGKRDEAVHVVEPGETLNGIANRAGVSARAIAEANGLKPPYVVRLGQKLRIPRKGAAAAQTDASRAQASSDAILEQETLHIVMAGETLGGIAQRAKVPRVLIAEANGLRPPHSVKAGQKLRIPRTRRHTVETGDTGFSISYKYSVPWEQIAIANGIDPEAPVKRGQDLLIPTVLDPPPVADAGSPVVPAPLASPSATPSGKARFLWPVIGPVRREFRTGSGYHDGIDITAPKGTMVRAAAAGIVKFAGNEKGQFGNLVVLDHGDGWFTAYGFLSRVTVKQGAKVAAGERIGLVGNTGLAKGDELHFEVRRGERPVDPLDELPKAP